MENELNIFTTRKGFNFALNHFQLVGEFSQCVGEGFNLADIVNYELSQQNITQAQVRPIIHALLLDKYEYAYAEASLPTTIVRADKIFAAVKEWAKIQVVIVYHNPLRGIVLINPADKEQLESALPLVRGEFCLILAGSAKVKNRAVLEQAVNDMRKLLTGKSVGSNAAYKGGARKSLQSYIKLIGADEDAGQPTDDYQERYTPPPAPSAPAEPAVESAAPSVQSSEPAPAAAAPSAPAPSAPAAAPADKGSGEWRSTPQYSVLVTNELFHNGNVEAWKRIIASYVAKFPGNEVLIWYENEQIHDINSLFKWGKVKSGTPIIFSIAGTNIGGVSKLQRYLFEGASPRFETFLAGSPNHVLSLF